jgi:hypothetical protein
MAHVDGRTAGPFGPDPWPRGGGGASIISFNLKVLLRKQDCWNLIELLTYYYRRLINIILIENIIFKSIYENYIYIFLWCSKKGECPTFVTGPGSISCLLGLACHNVV